MSEEQKVEFINHCGNAFGVSVPYQGISYVDVYELFLKDGSHIPVAYPRFLRDQVTGQSNLHPKDWIVIDFDKETKEIKQNDRMIKNEEISEIALLDHAGEFASLFKYNTVQRHRLNVVSAMRLGLMNPYEDLSSIRPESCRAMEIRLTCHYVNKKGVPEQKDIYPAIKCGGEHLELGKDGKWYYERDCSFELDSKSAYYPEPLAILKQLGCNVVVRTKTNFAIEETETLGNCVTNQYELEIVSVGRTSEDKIQSTFTQAGLAFSATLRFKRIFKKEEKNETVAEV